MIITLSGLYLLPTCSSTLITNFSNQLFWVLHLVSTAFLLGSYPKEYPSITTLIDAFKTVEKSGRELLEVLKCANVLSLPRSKTHIIMYNTRPIINSSLPGRGPKGVYNGEFPMSLHLLKFLLTSDKLLLIVEVYLPHLSTKCIFYYAS